MKQQTLLGAAAAVAFSIIVAFNSAFVVNEGTQALITQFGKIQGEPITTAGLYFKLPFVQDVRYFDKRILNWDGDPEQIPTRDKKYIWVDTTARWQIVDVRRFAEALQSESRARDRLDGILDGVTRDTVSSYNLVEAVRNSNAIFETIAARKLEIDRQRALPEVDPAELADLLALEEEITGEIERINHGREALSRLIVERASRELDPLGIELIDVQLRRIAYERGVEEQVYERMISERNRIAEKIRAIGMGEQAVIMGKLNLDLKEIESEAYRRSEIIKGTAEAEATAIFTQAMRADPEYYLFRRQLEAYRNALGKNGNFILSTDSSFLELLEKGPR